MSAFPYGPPEGYQSSGISSIDPPTSVRGPGHSSHTSVSSRQVSPVGARHQPGYGPGTIAGSAAEMSNHYDNSQAIRDIDNLYSAPRMSPSPNPGSHDTWTALAAPWTSHAPTHSQSSIAPLVTRQSSSPPIAGAGMAASNAGSTSSLAQQRTSYFHGDGYDDAFDPRDIADDGDDGLEEQPRQRGVARGAATGAAAAGAGAGIFKAFGRRDASGNYDSVSNGQDPEKSEWLRNQSSGNKRLKWIVGTIVALVIIAAIVGGVVGGILSSQKSGGSSSSSTDSDNGLWDINSSQVKAVLNNQNLFKVFPAMDYTPLNAQYPACLSNPLEQNNVTLDMAILGQLTPAIRLYGTDCNQTEMVLAGIAQLGYKDNMKVWLGVFLGTNTTTNDRQISQMYDVLDNNDASRFAGIIIGNEAIFEGGMSADDLSTQLTDIRNNLTSKNIQLPISTSQLGDDWTKNSALAQVSDIVMSNIHPFFAGVPAEQGASWAWTFWGTNDIPLTSATGTINGVTYPKQIISEIGWPTAGGQDCGDSNSPDYGCTSSTQGSIASIDNLNTFMDAWVCYAMGNTTYFWFEAFDEPWKHQFDTASDKWEPSWGLFDMYRNLKDGVKIPDCGGKTIDKPY